MDEQKKAPEFNINNTATQKTVRLKPMTRKPVVNISEAAQADKVDQSASFVAERVAQNNTTRPNTLLKTTASVPIRKVSGAPRTPASSLGGSVKPDSILNSLNLKPKESNVPTVAVEEVSPTQVSANTTKIGKITPASLAANKANMVNSIGSSMKQSSMAATQKFEPVAKNDTATGKVAKIDVAPAVADEDNDKTVKLKRPERKVAATPNSIVPPIAKVAEAKAPEVAIPTIPTQKAEPIVEELKVAPAKTVAPEPAVAAPKLTIPTLKKPEVAPKVAEIPIEAPKAQEPETPKIEEKEVELSAKKEKKETPKVENKASDIKIIETNATASKPFCFMYLVVLIALLVAVAVTAIQYLNTYEVEKIGGKEIAIPVVDNLIQK